MNEREQFEEHYRPQFHSVYFSSCNGVYADETMQARWMAWQARAALSAPPAGADERRLDWLDANPQVILRTGKQRIRPLIDAAMLAAAPQPAEPQERVLLMRSAEVGRWIQADGRSISGEYRYATLDPKEGE